MTNQDLQTTTDPLIQKAQEIVQGVSNFPDARLALRKNFYKKYGKPEPFSPYGYGDSELAFMQWEKKRGVLNPMDVEGIPPGSPWWREVNSHFLFLSTYAQLIYESKEIPPHSLEPPVRFWIDFIRKPEAATWYRAHNSSIIAGYVHCESIAPQETLAEQIFMNIVLYRVIFAQAMVERDTLLDDLGAVMANPEFEAVKLITSIEDFYPDQYPLTQKDIKEILGRGHSLGDTTVRILDNGIILPRLEEFYNHAVIWDESPELMNYIHKGKPYYPPTTMMKLPATTWGPGTNKWFYNALIQFLAFLRKIKELT